MARLHSSSKEFSDGSLTRFAGATSCAQGVIQGKSNNAKLLRALSVLALIFFFAPPKFTTYTYNKFLNPIPIPKRKIAPVSKLLLESC